MGTITLPFVAVMTTDGNATQHAAQIDVASIVVQRRSVCACVCERCRRNQRVRLQRRRMVPYSDVRRRT